jgi:hypothetical protein
LLLADPFARENRLPSCADAALRGGIMPSAPARFAERGAEREAAAGSTGIISAIKSEFPAR